MNKLQKFFSQKWMLIVAPIVYFIGVLGTDIDYLIYDLQSGIYYIGGDIFIAAVALVACLSYAKHNKNVMKAVVGGLLVYLCAISLDAALSYTVYFDPEYDTISDVIYAVVRAILAITFFINHLVLASNHKSNASQVKFNLIIGLLFMITAVVWEIYVVIVYQTEILYGTFWILFNIGLIALVMNIESKIDYFKQIRDEKEEASQEVSEN